jgi:hypothetical protein
MTEDQKAMAIHLGVCMFVPGSYDKRFAKNMWFLAAENPDQAITERQHNCLCKMTHRYRRQIPRDVVEIAEKYLGQKTA